MLTFTVNGKPQPKQRPRTVAYRGKSRTYTPRATKEAENKVRNIAMVEMHKQKMKPLKKSVGIEITFYGARANADIDNLLKVCLDGLNKTAFEDDRQVVDVHAVKRTEKFQPRTVISIWEIEDDNNEKLHTTDAR